MSEVFFLEFFFFYTTKFLSSKIFFFFKYNKTDLNFYHQKPSFFLHTTKQIWYFDKSKSFFLTIKTYLIFFNKKKKFHPYINLCDLIFHSHVQLIMHDMHSIVHWSQESKKPDFVWAEWVPNTFPFYNLASEFRFLV